MNEYLFVDIETVPCVSHISNLDPVMRAFWNEKYTRHKEEGETENDHFMRSAGLIPEFGQIVCLSAGYESKGEFKTVSYVSHYNEGDEKTLLESFLKMYRPTKLILVGHNLKYFDMPFINRRCLINGLNIPKSMEILDKAPRKINHIDTMEMYKNGGSRCSLGVISYLLTGEHPKTDISGADVARVFYEGVEKGTVEENVKRISEYCERDIEYTRKIFKIMKDQAKKEDPYFVEPDTDPLDGVPKSKDTPYADTANKVRQDMIKKEQKESKSIDDIVNDTIK